METNYTKADAKKAFMYELSKTVCLASAGRHNNDEIQNVCDIANSMAKGIFTPDMAKTLFYDSEHPLLIGKLFGCIPVGIQQCVKDALINDTDIPFDQIRNDTDKNAGIKYYLSGYFTQEMNDDDIAASLFGELI